MARKSKQTVDYFPHDCDHKKTLFIVEQKFGNDGYATWFKTLEMLGKSEGHYLDFNNEAEWEFLTSVCHIEGDLCRRILDLLAKLGAIDAELWQQNIVWSQNFVDRIADAYRKRTAEIPKRPDIYREKSTSDEQSDAGNPQSKVKESKVKESIPADAETHPPEIPKKAKLKKTPLPPDFKTSDRVKTWAKEKGFNNLDRHLESFVGKAKAKGYEYIDWDEAYMNAIRDNWAQLKNKDEPTATSAPGRSGDDPFSWCPACKREVLTADLTEFGCVKCEKPTDNGRRVLGEIMSRAMAAKGV